MENDTQVNPPKASNQCENAERNQLIRRMRAYTPDICWKELILMKLFYQLAIQPSLSWSYLSPLATSYTPGGGAGSKLAYDRLLDFLSEHYQTRENFYNSRRGWAVTISSSTALLPNQQVRFCFVEAMKFQVKNYFCPFKTINGVPQYIVTLL